MTTPESSAILIVDDDRGGREALEALLLTQGYALVLAGNGAEALQKLTEMPFDLVLLDVMMPGMDGYEVCRRIRAKPAIADIPVLMVTALNDFRSRLAGFEAGADDYITKPYDSMELFARVRTITRLNRFRRLVGERLKFQQLFDLSPNGQLIIDASGVVQLINKKSLEMLNVSSAGEVEGSKLSGWIVEDSQVGLECIIDEFLDHPAQSLHLETEVARKDHQFQPVDLCLGRIEFNNQAMVQVIMIDIRERIQMSADLSRERILLKTLIDTLPDFIFIKDRESRFLMANSALAHFFGFKSAEEVIGKTDIELYPQELVGRYSSDEQQVLDTGNPIVDQEEPVIDAQGNWLVFSTSKVALHNKNGEVFGLMGISRDITFQKNILRELEAAKTQQKSAKFKIDELKKKLTEKDQERRHFLEYGGGQFGWLAEKMAVGVHSIDKTDSGQLNPAKTVLKNVEIMRKISCDILEYSRLESATKVPEDKIFSITECIAAVVNSVSVDALKKRLTLQVKVDGSLPENVSGDYNGFYQVISRLLGNAIRVTDSGEVSLSVDLENYSPIKPSKSLFLHVAVADTGKNINIKDLPDLFQPFRGPGTEDWLPDNLSLDLAICRLIVEQAGGGIWVETRGDLIKGSVVHFSFKLAAV